jgi:hydroxypyruvate reductase
VQATRAILALVRDLGPNDLLIALVSGGGSALLEAPVPPLTLADIQETTRLLLRAGAPIEDLNAVRSMLSEVKGGGLRRAAGEATVASLILSDVLGNDPSVIASGPTVPATPDPVAARRVLERYEVIGAVPGAVVRAIEERHRDERAAIEPAHDVWRIIADNGTLIDAATAAADKLGLAPRVNWRNQEGEAADLAREFVTICADMPDGVNCVIGGGEATVTVRGSGVGGRNTEFALAAAIELERTGSGWSVASLASDGDDASTGAAGAIGSGATIARARAAGLDPEAELVDNNSAHVFAVAGGLVTPGLTGTNVNDLYIGIRG